MHWGGAKDALPQHLKLCLRLSHTLGSDKANRFPVGTSDMTHRHRTASAGFAKLALPLLITAALGGCAGDGGQSLLSGSEPTGSLSSGSAPKGAAAARDYWADALAKNPRDEKAAISFARALKAEGSKDKARSALQQAAMYNPESLAVASEQGRLALDMGQLETAEKFLKRATDPAKPDWRVLNALGTLEAQKGNKAGSKDYFERASKLAPREPSVLNNLALSYALDGDPAKAEFMLKQAAAAGGDTAKVRQNLALVLGVQGKHEEAARLESSDLDKGQAEANRAYMQKMVAATPVVLGKPVKVAKLATKPLAIPAHAWSTDVTPAVAEPVVAARKPLLDDAGLLADAGDLPWSTGTKVAVKE
jgi:Flp pilus assembly protein TadD